jgi:sucrose-phosphate synthase
MDDFKPPGWLLVSDVDDTLDGESEALLEFAGPARPLQVVLNSSRPRASVLRTLREFPRSFRYDGLITALGTEILLEGREAEGWTRRFDSWDRRPIDELMARFAARPHPAEMQTPHKASYAVAPPRWSEAEAELRARHPEARVIVSGESDFDVIPAAAGKDGATLFVAERLGIPLDRLVVAGDSANDLAMFAASPRSIAVGNARAELLERIDPRRTYCSRGLRAAGVLEGLRHWGAIPAHPKDYACQDPQSWKHPDALDPRLRGRGT